MPMHPSGAFFQVCRWLMLISSRTCRETINLPIWPLQLYCITYRPAEFSSPSLSCFLSALCLSPFPSALVVPVVLAVVHPHRLHVWFPPTISGPITTPCRSTSHSIHHSSPTTRKTSQRSPATAILLSNSQPSMSYTTKTSTRPSMNGQPSLRGSECMSHSNHSRD